VCAGPLLTLSLSILLIYDTIFICKCLGRELLPSCVSKRAFCSDFTPCSGAYSRVKFEMKFEMT
jgi:hypothetical protein